MQEKSDLLLHFTWFVDLFHFTLLCIALPFNSISPFRLFTWFVKNNSTRYDFCIHFLLFRNDLYDILI